MAPYCPSWRNPFSSVKGGPPGPWPVPRWIVGWRSTDLEWITKGFAGGPSVKPERVAVGPLNQII